MGEHISSLWVPLQCISRSEPLNSMGGRWAPIQTVSPSPSPVYEQNNHWQERVNTHPASESLSSVSADGNHWQEWVNTHPVCESLPVFQQIRTTEYKGWIPSGIQRVSPSPLSLQYISRSEPLTRMCEHPSREWVPLHHFGRSEPLTRTGEHLSRKWVLFWGLSRLELLMRMGGHLSREWVTLQFLSWFQPLTELEMGEHPFSMWVGASVSVDLIYFGWTCIQEVSPSAPSAPLMMLILCLDCNLLHQVSLPDSLINFIDLLLDLWSNSFSQSPL